MGNGSGAVAIAVGLKDRLQQVQVLVLEDVERPVQALCLAWHCREPRVNIRNGILNYVLLVRHLDVEGRKLEEDTQRGKPLIQTDLWVCER